MKNDISYGIIPLRRHMDQWQVLLVQHHPGHWAFPKGHSESNESPKETAERELFEETGLRLERFLLLKPLIENYIFTFKSEKIYKTVKYFLALVQGDVVIQKCEIQASEWLALHGAFERMTFSEGKRLCLEVSEFLKAFDEHGNPFIA